MPESYHRPVMLKQCIDGLDIHPDGVYVDATFGGGGHSEEILSKIPTGHLYAFDQDPDAKKNAAAFDSSRFAFIAANFRYLKRYLKMYNIDQVDGILADLGISSHQIDAGHRGFSTRFDGALDMRMSQAGQVSARSIINEYPAEDLQIIFSKYGEIKNSRTLSLAICEARENTKIETTGQLKAIAEKVAPRHREFKYFAQLFQSIRIAVNDELGALEDLLKQSVEILNPGGRIVVMTFHSLEDRIVKNFFRTGNFTGNPEKDFYGNLQRPLEPVNRKPLRAEDIEMEQNSRSRSAKLRIAKKI